MSYMCSIHDILDNLNERLSCIEERIGDKKCKDDLELVSSNTTVIETVHEILTVIGESQLSIFTVPFRITAYPGKSTGIWKNDDCNYIHFWQQKDIGVYNEPIVQSIPGFGELILSSIFQITIDVTSPPSMSQYDVYILNIPTVGIPVHNRYLTIYHETKNINLMEFDPNIENYIMSIQLIISSTGKILLRITPISGVTNPVPQTFSAGKDLIVRWRTN